MEDKVEKKIREARAVLDRLQEIEKAEQKKRLIGLFTWMVIIVTGVIVGVFGYRYVAENYRQKLPWLFTATPENQPVSPAVTCSDLEIKIENDKLMVPPDIVWGGCYNLVGNGVSVWEETFSVPENRRSLAESIGENEAEIALVETAIEASFTSGVLDLRSAPPVGTTATPEQTQAPTATITPLPTLLPAPEGIIPISELKQVMDGMGVGEVRAQERIKLGDYSLWSMYYSATDYLAVKIGNEYQLPNNFLLSTTPSEGASLFFDLWMK